MLSDILFMLYILLYLNILSFFYKFVRDDNITVISILSL